jgi:predicted dehydrogenase
MTESAKLKVGIIGAGIMGDLHARTYMNNPAVELVAFCDINLARTSEAASKYKVSKSYQSYLDMFADVEMDLVSVCTPDFAHAEPVIAAANAGKHVLVEKPLATSVSDAEEIIRAAQRNQVKIMAQFSHRWVPAYRQAKDLISRSEAGEPVLAYTRKNDIIYVPTKMIAGWSDRTNPSWFLSSHDIDLVCWYFEAEPVEVFASAVNKVLVKKGFNTPDAIQAQVRFANDALATFEACWIYPDTFPTMVDSFVQIVCENQVIHLDRKCEQIEIATPLKHEYPRNLLAYSYENGQIHGAVPLSINHFVQCVQENLPPLVTLESSLTVTRILDAIDRSIKTNERIKLN